MKVTSARWSSANEYFCVDFEDGITLFINDEHQVCGMLSTGLNSYFLKTQKWPGRENLETRKSMASVWISKNKKRYKSKK